MMFLGRPYTCQRLDSRPNILQSGVRTNVQNLECHLDCRYLLVDTIVAFFKATSSYAQTLYNNNNNKSKKSWTIRGKGMAEVSRREGQWWHAKGQGTKGSYQAPLGNLKQCWSERPQGPLKTHRLLPSVWVVHEN